MRLSCSLDPGGVVVLTSGHGAEEGDSLNAPGNACWEPDNFIKCMLCDSCHQRPATCHIVSIVDDVQQTRDLCEECWEASSPEAKELASAQREARCEYCGGQPCAGGTDFLALGTGMQRMKFMCMPCTLECQRFTEEELPRVPGGLSPPEQLTSIRMLRDKVDEHMKQWVSGRDSE